MYVKINVKKNFMKDVDMLIKFNKWLGYADFSKIKIDCTTARKVDKRFCRQCLKNYFQSILDR